MNWEGQVLWVWLVRFRPISKVEISSQNEKIEISDNPQRGRADQDAQPPAALFAHARMLTHSSRYFEGALDREDINSIFQRRGPQTSPRFGSVLI